MFLNKAGLEKNKFAKSDKRGASSGYFSLDGTANVISFKSVYWCMFSSQVFAKCSIINSCSSVLIIVISITELYLL